MKHTRPTVTNLIIAGATVSGFVVFGLLTQAPEILKPSAELAVPYISQVPDDQWVAPWDEACEEATISMIDAFYRGELIVDKDKMKANMLDMFAWEDEAFNKNHDTDAAQTVQLIAKKSGFIGTVKRNPLIEDIKRELAASRPVIAHVNMYKLYQEKDLGDSYHVFVITGYNDLTGEFIINDPARPKDRYTYAVLMNALHDFNPKTREADAAPTVIFTRKR